MKGKWHQSGEVDHGLGALIKSSGFWAQLCACTLSRGNAFIPSEEEILHS